MIKKQVNKTKDSAASVIFQYFNGTTGLSQDQSTTQPQICLQWELLTRELLLSSFINAILRYNYMFHIYYIFIFIMFFLHIFIVKFYFFYLYFLSFVVLVIEIFFYFLLLFLSLHSKHNKTNPFLQCENLLLLSRLTQFWFWM